MGWFFKIFGLTFAQRVDEREEKFAAVQFSCLGVLVSLYPTRIASLLHCLHQAYNNSKLPSQITKCASSFLKIKAIFFVIKKKMYQCLPSEFFERLITFILGGTIFFRWYKRTFRIVLEAKFSVHVMHRFDVFSALFYTSNEIGSLE